MASFTLHDGSGTDSYSFVEDSDNAFFSKRATPNAPTGSRGPGGAYNSIVPTKYSFEVEGVNGPTTINLCIWSSNGVNLIYASPLLTQSSFDTTPDASVANLTHNIDTDERVAISGNTTYCWGAHNESSNGMTAQRRVDTGTTFYGDLSHATPGSDLSFTDFTRADYSVVGTITYIYLPSAPTLALSGVVGGQKQISVTWSAPAVTGDAAISKYLVYYKKSTDSSWTTVDTGSTSLSYTLTGLESNTTYNIRVAAWNAASDVIGQPSDYSATQNATTLPSGPQVRSNSTTWSPSEIRVCTVNGSWPTSANGEMYVWDGEMWKGLS